MFQYLTMKAFEKFSVVRSLLLFLLFPLSFIFCYCGQSSQKSVKNSLNTVNDSNLLFDGKSLEGWKITNFGPQGPVYISGGEIILGRGDGCTGITWKKDFPTSNYQVNLDARRVDGNDFFCGMTFPVGKDFCSLIIGGWAGTTVGLSTIDGMDASENTTTSLIKFENKQWYHICLTVTESEIKAMIDSTRVVDFAISNHKLSIRSEVELSKPFGIASWNTTAAIRNIRVLRIAK
jgi:hypothetical protein